VVGDDRRVATARRRQRTGGIWWPPHACACLQAGCSTPLSPFTPFLPIQKAERLPPPLCAAMSPAGVVPSPPCAILRLPAHHAPPPSAPPLAHTSRHCRRKV
jgi:hypothetical protein